MTKLTLAFTFAFTFALVGCASDYAAVDDDDQQNEQQQREPHDVKVEQRVKPATRHETAKNVVGNIR